MKTIYTFALLIAISLQLHSQSIYASSYTESTHISPKIGAAVGFSFSNQIELGGFYQNSVTDVPTRSDGYKIYEETFMGMYFNYPIVSDRLASLKLNVRTGVTNSENFTITPSLLANYNLLKTMQLGVGVGVRAFRPTLQASVKFKMWN